MSNFSRPDSIVDGNSVYSVRKAIGAQLAIESPVDVDYVIPVPDSGVPGAIGFAQQSGIPFELASSARIMSAARSSSPATRSAI